MGSYRTGLPWEVRRWSVPLDAIGKGGRVRHGIIGTGMMGCEHILNLAAIDGAEIVAVADPHAESLELARLCLGDRTPDVSVFGDHRSLLAGVGDDLDAVIIATPNVHHIDVLRDILAEPRHDALHVMVEKPMCTTVDDCRRVVEWAGSRSSLTWVALEYRYMPTVAAFVAEIAAGTIGDLKMVSIREHRFPFLTKVGDWNRFSANTGGTLVEKCCHFFDLMNLVVGARPVRVFASGGQDVNHLDEVYERPDGSRARPDILDNAFVIVDYANGARAALDLCMFAEGGRYEQELSAVGPLAKVETTVPGDTVWVGPRDGSPRREVPAPLSDEVRYEGFHHGSSYREHLRFIDAARTGSAAEVGTTDGLWSVAVGAAAHQSIEEGRPVTIELG